MFPLTDLSILFTALLIIALLCLGLIVLLGILIYRMYNRKNRSENTIPASPNTVTTPAPQPTTQQNIIERIDNVHKEVIFGTNVAIYGLAFAFTVYTVQVISSGHYLTGLFSMILSLIMLALSSPQNRSSLGKYLRKHPKSFRIIYKIIIWAFVAFTAYVIIILILHI